MCKWKKIYSLLMIKKIPFIFYDKGGVDTFKIEPVGLEIQCPEDGNYIVNGNEVSEEEIIKALFKGE